MFSSLEEGGGRIVAVHFVGGLIFLGVPHFMGVPSNKG